MVQGTAVEKAMSLSKFQKTLPEGGVHTIITHPSPHLDEIASIYLLQKYGKGKIKGIETAELGYANQEEVRGRSFEEYLKEGYLLVGTGGGPLDEHGKKYGRSAAQLVSEFLGIKRNPELRTLLSYINFEDTNGDTSSLLYGKNDFKKHAAKNFLLATQIKKTWIRIGDDIDQIQKFYKLFHSLIEMHVDDELEFLEAKKKIANNIQIIDLKRCSVAEDAKLVIVRNGDRHTLRTTQEFLREKKVNFVAILKIDPSGRFQVFSNNAFKIEGQDLIRILRTKEFERKGQKVPNWNELRYESLEGSDLHFHRDANNVYNGTHTQQEVTPLIGNVLKEGDVVWAVATALEDDMFDKKFQNECRKGFCAKGKCPLYKAGLNRCFNIRNIKE